MKPSLKLLSPQVSGIVYASAGTGKTWQLISRVLRLLLDGVCPSSILAITFTNKAADEMRDRVNERIFKWNIQPSAELEASLREIGIDDIQKYSRQARGLYEKLLHSTEQLQITTFHAFCQKLISLCPLQSNVALGFQIAEDAVQWQEKAIDILFRTTTLEHKKIAEALDVLYDETRSLNNVRTILRAFLARQNDWYNYVADTPDGVADAARRLYRQLKIDETIPADRIWQDIRSAIADYGELLEAHSTQKNIAHAECLKQLITLDKLSDEEFAKLNNCIHTGSGKPRQRKLTQTLINSLGEDDAYRLLDLCTEISTAVMQMSESNNRHSNYRLNRAWYVVGSRLLKIYAELKQQNNLLDFDDLEITASQLLTQADYGSHWIQYRLASRIEHILIDEFQDTNPTQWQLLQPLMQEIASQRCGSVFIVGDRKQSIYGFRRADPELQVTAGRWLKQHLSGLEESAELSYRSAPCIIAFVNAIFTESNILPDFKHHETTRSSKGGIHIFDLFEPPVVNKKHDASEWRNPMQTPLLSPQDSHIEEAETVAKTIKQIYQNKLTIEADGKESPIKYSDILIIARQKTHFDLFTRALRRLQIPVVSASEADLFSRLEITDMLQLLTALHNPYNDLAIAQVLRSPIYSLSDRHLLQLSEQEGTRYFTKLKALANQGDTLWSNIYRDLKEWSALCGRLPIHDLLYTIFDQLNLISRYRASVHPVERDQTQLHLEAFLEYTLDYDSGRYPDVARFLEYIETRHGLDGEGSAPQGQNCIRMMSIHGAKGLEAAVVFLIDCAFKLLHKDTHNVLVDWPTEDSSPRHFVLLPPTARRSKLLSELTEMRHLSEQREEMNLLYVALTRAKQYLFISGSGKSKSEQEHWYRLIKKSCGEYTTFGDDPLKPTKNAKQRPTKPKLETALDLKLFTDKVPLNVLTKQIEPSSIGMDKNRFAAAATTADARLRGSIIHKALELLNQQPYDSLAAFQRSLGCDSEDDNDMFNACAEEAWMLMQKPDIKALLNNARYQKTYREMPLLYEDDEGQIVYGKVDQVCVGKDEVLIIDYKTSRPPKHNPEQFYRKLAARYLPQMRCYKEGIAKLFPHKTIKMSLLFTNSGFVYNYPSLENSICSSNCSGST